MKWKIFLLALLAAACVILFGCSVANQKSFSLHETPQTYVLQDETAVDTMPTISLYKNGNARLSQPLISSYAILGIGKYEINGNKLIIAHGDSAKTTFEVSEDGDTLTLLTSNLGFTKVGSVYKYRSGSDELNNFTKVEGKQLTLDILRELAKKAPDISVSDFDKYYHYDKGSDHHIFKIEGKYRLELISAPDDMHCIVECNASGERFPLNMNGSTGYVFDNFLGLTSIPECKIRKWFDCFNNNTPGEGSKELTLTEFPGVTFKWTSEKVTANDKELFRGMPIWNVYLADLTNDGIPEFCATVSIGSGIIDNRVIVFDYVEDKEYQLSDRMYYDYFLSLDNGELMVTQTRYLDKKPLVTSELRLVNGEIFRFGNPIEDKRPYAAGIQQAFRP